MASALRKLCGVAMPSGFFVSAVLCSATVTPCFSANGARRSAVLSVVIVAITPTPSVSAWWKVTSISSPVNDRS